MTELKPCPWCDSVEHLVVSPCGSLTADMPDRPYRVVCNHIDHDQVQGPVEYGRYSAIRAWNTRAAPRSDGEVGELVRLCLSVTTCGCDEDEAAAIGRQAAAHLTALSAEVERLTAGLQSIANNGCCDQCQEAAKVAKHILTGPHVPQAALGAKP